MRVEFKKTLSGWLLLLTIFGCSSHYYWEGQSLLQTHQYHQALVKLLVAESRSPNDYKPKRDIGITYFHVKNYPRALQKLQQAKQLKPNDALTTFYLGNSYEMLGQLDAALQEYTQIENVGRFNRVGGLIRKRISDILRRKITTEVKTAVEQEQSLMLATIPENSMAVLYFKNISEWKQLTPLEKGLAQMVITDLSQVNALRLVERLKLEQLIQELNLTQSALFEPTTVPRLGRLLGARRLVKGGFVSNNEGEIQIVTAIIESSTGEMVTKEIQVRGGIHNFFNLEKQLIFNIVQALELRLSLAEMEAIRKVPTKNFLAFLAFGEGLDFEDQGRWQEAQKSFQKAVSLDPNFVEAQSRLNLLQQPALTNIELTQKVMDLAWRTAETRLMTTTQNIIKGTLPITAEDPSVARPKGTAIVQVQGTLPSANSGDGRH